MLGYGAGFAALAGAVHLVLRLRAPYADPVLLPIATAINGLGLVMIHRLDLAEGRAFGESLAFAPADVDRDRGDRRRSPSCWCCATTGC